MEGKKLKYRTIAGVVVVSAAILSHAVDPHTLMFADIKKFHTPHKDFGHPMNTYATTFTTVTSSSTSTTTS